MADRNAVDDATDFLAALPRPLPIPEQRKRAIETLPLRDRYLFGLKVQAVLAIFKTPRQRERALEEMLAMRDDLTARISGH